MELERQNSLIYAMHCGLSESIQSKAKAGHFGRDKCFAMLTQHYNFPMMQDRIQMLMKNCEPCQLQNTHKLEKCGHQLQLIKIEPRGWAQIGVNLIRPLQPSRNNNRYICTVVDYFRKYIKAKALPNKTGLLVGEYLFELMCRYGVMDITIIDLGKIELF